MCVCVCVCVFLVPDSIQTLYEKKNVLLIHVCLCLSWFVFMCCGLVFVFLFVVPWSVFMCLLSWLLCILVWIFIFELDVCLELFTN